MNAVLEALQKAVEEAGSQKALGERMGVSGPFISMMLSGDKKVPDSILNQLGFERIVVEKEQE